MEPWLTAKLDHVAADPDTVLELLAYGDFYVAVDDETGEVEKIPRPE